jgi:hypothetical protein
MTVQKANRTPEEVKVLVEEINKWLWRGDKKKIATSLKYTPEYTCEVLAGRQYNEDIVDAAFEKAMERKEKHIRQTNRIKQLQ